MPNNYDVAVARYTNNPVIRVFSDTDWVELPVNLKASTTYTRGMRLGELTATPGKFAPYNSGGADGSQTAKCVLPFACSTDASGNITIGSNADPAGVTYDSVAAIFVGIIRCEDVPGLDATTAGQLGRLMKGTVSAGYLKIG